MRTRTTSQNRRAHLVHVSKQTCTRCPRLKTDVLKGARFKTDVHKRCTSVLKRAGTSMGPVHVCTRRAPPPHICNRRAQGRHLRRLTSSHVRGPSARLHQTCPHVCPRPARLLRLRPRPTAAFSSLLGSLIVINLLLLHCPGAVSLGAPAFLTGYQMIAIAVSF